MPPMIYLDNNATTRMAPQVADAMAEALRAGYANPASQHEEGRRARRVLENARQRIGELLGAQMTGREPDRVILTSGGTEANHLAVRGIASSRVAAQNGGSPVVVSAIEHPSLLAAAQSLAATGCAVLQAPADRQGVVDLDWLAASISPATPLVSVMLGNNETGVLQPVARIARLCRAAGIPMHTDAVQAVGKIDVSFAELGVDAMSVAPHKFHGPVGIGALVVRPQVPLAPQLEGGFQQQGLRAGTEGVALAVGFRAALELWHDEREERLSRMRGLRDQFERDIVAELTHAMVIGAGAERLPGTANIAFRGLDRQALVMALDLAGIACSTGSACASGSSEPSPVLLAMGCDEDVIGGSIRLSLGADTTAAEISEATRRILRVCKQLGQAK
jgi:cysteine desulfurase